MEKNGVLDACKELGVKVLAYSPLGRGFLTGASPLCLGLLEAFSRILAPTPALSSACILFGPSLTHRNTHTRPLQVARGLCDRRRQRLPLDDAAFRKGELGAQLPHRQGALPDLLTLAVASVADCPSAEQEFERLAKQKGCSPAQLALAWLIHQGDNIIPIPGVRPSSVLSLPHCSAPADRKATLSVPTRRPSRKSTSSRTLPPRTSTSTQRSLQRCARSSRRTSPSERGTRPRG